MLKGFVLGLLCALCLSVSAAPPIHVGVGKPVAGRVFGATTNAGSLTVNWTQACVYPNRMAQVWLHYSSTTGAVHDRTLSAPPNHAQLTDNFGNLVGNPEPAALGTDSDAWANDLDTSLTAAAAANKLNF